ncbi:acetyl-CoA carboxylase carboxyltransferase subunit alpha [bacterium]|jgi:acetyl-CoA carboxylase carboxyl transferase subunit alpha|nr:acetyl-CoA carboxylase carboxyltransferase subunit alpha [bacterium]
MKYSLSFEKPISDLYQKIEQLKELADDGGIDLSVEVGKIEERADHMKKEIYAKLTPSQIVQIARHIKRPNTVNLCNLIFKDFIELHGDRLFSDDPSIVGGIGFLKKHRVMIIGHQKGHDTKENIKRNFGMPHPEGYRKALRLMKMAENFNMPIVTFIDTPGAYPGIGAEERGQAEAIARNLKEMTGLRVPVISVVIGEGGSGGALGIGVSNKLYMMQNAVYSVISPEGCASILFKDAKKADRAASSLKITSKDIVGLGISDGVIEEPLGGAHHDWDATADKIKKVLVRDLTAYKKMDVDVVIDERCQKFRSMGNFGYTS